MTRSPPYAGVGRATADRRGGARRPAARPDARRLPPCPSRGRGPAHQPEQRASAGGRRQRPHGCRDSRGRRPATAAPGSHARDRQRATRARRAAPIPSRAAAATLAQLRDQPFVTLVHGSGHRAAFEKAFDDAGFLLGSRRRRASSARSSSLPPRGSAQRSFPSRPRREPTSRSSRSPARAFSDAPPSPGTRPPRHLRGVPSSRSPIDASTPQRGREGGPATARTTTGTVGEIGHVRPLGQA